MPKTTNEQPASSPAINPIVKLNYIYINQEEPIQIPEKAIEAVNNDLPNKPTSLINETENNNKMQDNSILINDNNKENEKEELLNSIRSNHAKKLLEKEIEEKKKEEEDKENKQVQIEEVKGIYLIYI